MGDHFNPSIAIMKFDFKKSTNKRDNYYNIRS